MIISYFRIAYLFSFLLTAVSCQSKGSIVLFEKGSTSYKIVVSDKVNPNNQKAALVLQDYLKRITKVEFSIVSQKEYRGEKAIYIGESPKANYSKSIVDDGFVIESQDNNLLIYGNSGKGTLYGVYEFLESYLNCQKPVGGEPAIVPQLSAIKIASDIKDIQNPDFIYRQSYYPSSTDAEYLDWHKLQQFEDLWGLWGHSFFKIVDPEKYFNPHPEYFALVGGVRQKTQLCLSNHEVQKLAINYFKTAIADNPDAVYWSISPMDNVGYCRCDNCQKIDKEEGGPQGSLIRFVNTIAKQFPENKFTTLAYTYSSKPPHKTKPADNVYIMLSSIDAFRTQPLEVEPSAKGFRENLKSWASATENIFIWDYTTQFTNYLTPFPDYNHIQENINFFKKNNVKGVFFHGSEEDFSDMASLSSFLQAKALWKSEEKSADHKTLFLKTYYGKAAPFITKYIAELQNAIKASGSQLDIYGNPINDRKGYLSPENIVIYSSLLDEAQSAVENIQPHAKHVEELRLGLEYVVLQQSIAYGTEKHGYLTFNADKEIYEINPTWRGRVDRFIQTVKKIKIFKLAEVDQTIDSYKESWDTRFSKGWINNPARNASLSLANPFSEEYPANGINTLVDGIEGQKDFSYNWLLFNGKNLELTLDFKKEKEIKNVRISFLHDPKHYIFLPTAVKLLASEDGKHFKEIAQRVIASTGEDFSIRREAIDIPLNYFAPFYKVIAVCPVQLPVWRFHATKKASIAIDEVVF